MAHPTAGRPPAAPRGEQAPSLPVGPAAEALAAEALLAAQLMATPFAVDVDADPLAAELDAIAASVRADLGSDDRAYITGMIAKQRKLEMAGRLLLLGARYRPAAVLGTGVLTVAKVIENMELGHNIMHGQWDWMRDPEIHSTTWEWDAVSTAKSWKHAHNFQHHTFTNVLGRDRDLGYSAFRVEPEQPWNPVYLAQPVYFFLMGAVFEWAIALYDIELDAVRRREKSFKVARMEVAGMIRKAGRQALKDYAVFPALAGRRGARRALAANAVANVARNLWVQTIVFCGHIPEGAETFTEEQYQGETRSDWYRRQLAGSCNLEGSKRFHQLTGHLSFQIEHHLFPDLPSNRYPEIAPQVRAVCERHGLAYNSGRLGRQYGSVLKQILRLSLPGGK